MTYQAYREQMEPRKKSGRYLKIEPIWKQLKALRQDIEECKREAEAYDKKFEK